MNRYYVAYGSNLHLEQMAYRCPDAKIVGTGELKNWQLRFKGSKTGAYATIDRCKGYNVPVLVWDISALDEKSLDRYEGFPTFYYKQNVVVSMADGSKLKGMVYIMTPRAKVGVPSNQYVNTVYNGYKQNNLDVSILERALGHNIIECRNNHRAYYI